MNPKCELQGCRADATYKVGCNCHRGIYGAERHIIGVCSDCRDQMLEWGWELMFPAKDEADRQEAA